MYEIVISNITLHVYNDEPPMSWSAALCVLASKEAHSTVMQLSEQSSRPARRREGELSTLSADIISCY